MEYFLLYILTLFIDVTIGGEGVFLFFFVIAYCVAVIATAICHSDKNEEEGKLIMSKIMPTMNKVAVFMCLWVGVVMLSPSKEEAIFIAVGGMALQNDIDERVISLLGKTLEMSEEGITYITNELKELNEEVPKEVEHE